MDFIGNSNIDGWFLNRGKLQLNRKRTVVPAENLYRFVTSLPLDWIMTGHEGAFIRDEVNSLDNHSDLSEMKKLRLRSPKNIFLVPEYKLYSE